MNLITREAELIEICREIDKGRRCAIDLEFIPERTYAPVLCLVQVATDYGAHIIDPLAIASLQSIWERIADPEILVVLHAANQDLDIINALSGKIPCNIFDTQIAAGFAGYGYPIGYGKLLNQLLGISIDKTESFTDWMTRPLTASQMSYAIDDVRHLLPIYDRLAEKLAEMGRLSWVREECKRYVDPSRYQKDRSQDFLKIKGASALNHRTLAVLQALCDWRHEEAARANKPAKAILADNTLLELSRRPPRHCDDVKRVRSIRPDQVRHFGQAIIQATEKGLATPEHLLPAWPASRMPPKKDVLTADMLFAFLKVFVYQAQMATELVGTRDDMQALVRIFCEGDREKSDLPLLTGWRWELAGKRLWSILEGTPVSMILDGSQDPPIQIKLINNQMSN